MATSNAIAIKRLEQERELKNRELDLKGAELALKESEIAIARDRLAEEVRNNLRNFNINLSKNEIQKLANDQLNEREATKILETIRHNLEVEKETNRHNLSEEQLKQIDQQLKELEVTLEAGKPTGKTAGALLTSYFLNRANLMNNGKLSVTEQSMIDWLRAGDKVIPSIYDPVNNTWRKGDKNDRVPASDGAFLEYGRKKYYSQRKQRANDAAQSEVVDRINKTGKYRKPFHSRTDRLSGREDEEEIVEDFTYPGPGERRNDYETTVGEKESPSPSNGTTEVRSINERGNASESGESRGQSKVIYSGGSQTGPGWSLIS